MGGPGLRNAFATGIKRPQRLPPPGMNYAGNHPNPALPE